MIRQKLASVELGSPSLALSRMNGFSPVRMVRLASATLIWPSPSGTLQPVPALIVPAKGIRSASMVELFRRSVAILFAGIVGLAGAASAQPAPSAGPSSEPPARVGRLAFVQGAVSFHDRDQTDWAPAVVNTPLTSGDALWTEPNARSEISIAGTRVRMDSGTQVDMLAI